MQWFALDKYVFTSEVSLKAADAFGEVQIICVFHASDFEKSQR